jgi:hypothetical protein
VSSDLDEEDQMMQIINRGFISPEIAKPEAPRVLPEPSLEDDRTIVMSLMRASQLTIAPLIEKEADIYTVADLKVRFR